MPHSIWPVAILAPRPKRALQAGAAGLHHGDGRRGRRESRCRSPPRGRGSSPWRGSTTAPPTTSSICAPCSAKRSTRPPSAARQHVEIGELGVSRVRAAERNPHPAKHRHAPHLLFRHADLQLPLAHAASAGASGLLLRAPVMQRAAAEGREARAEDHAGIDMIGARHDLSASARSASSSIGLTSSRPSVSSSA